MRTLILLAALALVALVPSVSQAGDCFAGQAVFSTGGGVVVQPAFSPFFAPRVAFAPVFAPRRDVFLAVGGRAFIPNVVIQQRGLLGRRLNVRLGF